MLVLGTFPPDPEAGPMDVYYRGLDRHLDGWARKCIEPNGLKWLMDRMAGTGDGRTRSDPAHAQTTGHSPGE